MYVKFLSVHHIMHASKMSICPHCAAEQNNRNQSTIVPLTTLLTLLPVDYVKSTHITHVSHLVELIYKDDKDRCDIFVDFFIIFRPSKVLSIRLIQPRQQSWFIFLF